jgi:hypothetical protein
LLIEASRHSIAALSDRAIEALLDWTKSGFCRFKELRTALEVEQRVVALAIEQPAREGAWPADQWHR